jgi:LPXTG-motif cell wall-anchored protein
MKVTRNVFAIIFFGLGAALIFLANHTVDNTFTSFETALFGGIGAMLLLGAFFLLRRKVEHTATQRERRGQDF